MEVNKNSLNGVTKELERQRNQALAGMAPYAGQVEDLAVQLAAAQAKIKELEAQIDKLECAGAAQQAAAAA